MVLAHESRFTAPLISDADWIEKDKRVLCHDGCLGRNIRIAPVRFPVGEPLLDHSHEPKGEFLCASFVAIELSFGIGIIFSAIDPNGRSESLVGASEHDLKTLVLMRQMDTDARVEFGQDLAIQSACIG